MAQLVKNPPAMQETQVQPLGQEDPLEKGMATFPCRENPVDRGAWKATAHGVTESGLRDYYLTVNHNLGCTDQKHDPLTK